MPCYADTVALHNFYGEFATDGRRMLWDAYRAWLSHADARVADPAAHSLWAMCSAMWGPGAAALLERLDLPADRPDLPALRARLALA